MRPPPSDAERLARRSLFGDAAEDYAAVRPGYPDVVVEWIAERVPLGPATRILEVGCGTGQATRLLAGPGCRITALEPHPALAAIAKRELNTPAIAVVESTFEGFAAPPGNYDVVVCAASYHWLDPGTRADSLARLLRPAGALAILYNEHPAPFTGFFLRVQDVYARIAPAAFMPPAAETAVNPFLEELEDCDALDRIETRTVAWSRTCSRSEYLRLLNTYSDHRRLDEAVRADLFDAIGRLIDEEFGGCVDRPYRAVLHLASALPTGLR